MTSHEKISSLASLLESKPHLHRIGRLFVGTVLMEVDGKEAYLTFEKGRITSIVPGPSRRTPWVFAIRTDSEALDAFWKPRPAPGFHDIFALAKLGRLRIDGDILALVRNLRFFKELLALPRSEVAL